MREKKRIILCVCVYVRIYIPKFQRCTDCVRIYVYPKGILIVWEFISQRYCTFDFLLRFELVVTIMNKNVRKKKRGLFLCVFQRECVNVKGGEGVSILQLLALPKLLSVWTDFFRAEWFKRWTQDHGGLWVQTRFGRQSASYLLSLVTESAVQLVPTCKRW